MIEQTLMAIHYSYGRTGTSDRCINPRPIMRAGTGQAVVTLQLQLSMLLATSEARQSHPRQGEPPQDPTGRVRRRARRPEADTLNMLMWPCHKQVTFGGHTDVNAWHPAYLETPPVDARKPET